MRSAVNADQPLQLLPLTGRLPSCSLRQGGAVSIMDMNPASAIFASLASNLFIFTALKSTEPWLDEYMSTPMNEVFQEAGFEKPTLTANTPRHRTLVAHKL